MAIIEIEKVSFIVSNFIKPIFMLQHRHSEFRFPESVRVPLNYNHLPAFEYFADESILLQ